MCNKKGFTLIEMLVVIAIIAILVAIIIPVVNSATTKAKASADAANLRTVMSEFNIKASDGSTPIADIAASIDAPESKLVDGAVMKAVYEEPGFVAIYYVSGSAYYSLEYLSDVATNGESSLSTAAPSYPDGTWYTLGS